MEYMTHVWHLRLASGHWKSRYQFFDDFGQASVTYDYREFSVSVPFQEEQFNSLVPLQRNSQPGIRLVKGILSGISNHAQYCEFPFVWYV